MGTVRNNWRRSSSKTITRRKYLGEPEDPHFIPNSPIISRQSLSLEQEEELTRTCTLVLSGVQHADEDEDDPLTEFITTQFISKSHIITKAGNIRDRPKLTKSSTATTNLPNLRSQKPRRGDIDTATPSETSKRDTLNRTDVSTPMTSVSETERQSPVLQEKSATLRQLNTRKSLPLCGYTGKSGSGSLRGDVPPPARSMTSLTSLEAAIGQHSGSLRSAKGANVTISRLEFNKNLPPLPSVVYGPAPEKQSTGLSRVFRKMKKQQPNDEGSKVSHKSIIKSVQRVDTSSSATTKGKPKFNISSLFDRSKRNQTT